MTGSAGYTDSVASVAELPLLLALGVAGLAVLDVAIEPALVNARTLVAAMGTGLGTGGLVALIGVVASRVLHARPLVVCVIGWLVVGMSFAAWIIESLAVIEKLTSAHRRLAVQSLAAALVAGAGLALLGVAVQPRRAHARGWVVSQRPFVRAILAGGVLLLSGAMTWMDRLGALVTYPSAETALRWLNLAALVFASHTLGMRPRARLAAGLRRGWPAAAGVTALSIFLVDGPTAAALMDRPYARLALSTLRWTLDLDRDGHSPVLSGGDCDDLDAAINPSAREVPGNGIDENCTLGDAPGSSGGKEAGPPPAASGPSPVSVVLITADTAAATHMSLYGYHRATTPNIDAWSRDDAVVFDRAFTSGSATAVAFSSMFRGVYARRLQWTRVAKTWNGHFVPLVDGATPVLAPGDHLNRIYRLPVHDPKPPLPWWLERRGMKTFGVTPVHFADPASGVVGELDEYVSLAHRGTADPDDEGTTRQALEWLGHMTSGDRYFLWVHYLGPHAPTTRKQGVQHWGSSVVDGYDHEIATFDQRVAPLLDALKARQRQGEPLAVILSADHGEELGYDRYHGHVLTESVTRVPLVISSPGAVARRSSQLVSTVDIFPTILSLTATPAPESLDGIDLSPFLAGDGERRERVVLADGWISDVSDKITTNLVMATDGHHQIVRSFTEQTLQGRELDASRAATWGRNPPGVVAPLHLLSAIDSYIEETGALPYQPQSDE